MFEPHPLIMDFRHVIPLMNCHPELACSVGYHVGNVDCLQLFVVHPGDVSKLKEVLDCGEYGSDWVAWVVIRLLDNVLPFQKFLQHQLTVVFLKVRKYACQCVVDRVRGSVANIR